jgi:putative FmdB family regulatory protein
MPLYEYRCEACGEKEEKLQSFSAPTEHDCSACGASTGMKRQISTTAFALSGDGWYASGYGSSGKSEAPAAAPATPAASGGSCCSGCPHAH